MTTTPTPAALAITLMLLTLTLAATSALRWYRLDQAGALAGASGDGELRSLFFEAQTHARDAVTCLALSLPLLAVFAMMYVTT